MGFEVVNPNTHLHLYVITMLHLKMQYLKNLIPMSTCLIWYSGQLFGDVTYWLINQFQTAG